MTIYRRLIPPLVPIGSGAAVSDFASLMVERLRNKERAPHKDTLDDWEDEGGSVATTDVVAL